MFDTMLDKAIKKLELQIIPVYTFSLYHDHEGNRVSVCVDTKENSQRVIKNINSYNMRYFRQALQKGALKSARLWQANAGRSLSLGDFRYANFAEEFLKSEITIDESFYVLLINLLLSKEHLIVPLAPDPHELLFTCSGSHDEVDLTWSATILT